MPKFREKPVEIEAVQFDGSHRITEWTGLTAQNAGAIFWKESALVIRTMEGDLVASPGDWIIRGIKGEIYPCKDDIFAATYDEVRAEIVTQDEAND